MLLVKARQTIIYKGVVYKEGDIIDNPSSNLLQLTHLISVEGEQEPLKPEETTKIIKNNNKQQRRNK